MRFIHFTLLLLCINVLLSCAQKPKAEERAAIAVAPEPRIVYRARTPDISAARVENAAQDIFAIAGVDYRSLNIHFDKGVLTVSGDLPESGAPQSALSVLSMLKGVNEVRDETSSGTLSGATSAVEPEAESLLQKVIHFFWPILTLIAVGFGLIAAVAIQVALYKRKIRQRGILQKLALQ